MKPKKRVFSFLGIVAALVVVAVLLIVVIFPEPKLDLVYCDAFEVSANIDLKYIREGLEEITEDIEVVSPSNQLITKLEKYSVLMNSYEKLNLQMQSGLMFNQRNKQYNKIAKQIDSNYIELIKNAKECKFYLKDIYFVYTSTTTYTMNDLERYLDTFYELFEKTIKLEQSFYSKLVTIYNESVEPSLKNNKSNLVNVNICNQMIEKNISKFDDQTLAMFNITANQCEKDFSNVSFIKSNSMLDFYNKENMGLFIDNVFNGTTTDFIENQANKTQYNEFFNTFFNV